MFEVALKSAIEKNIVLGLSVIVALNIVIAGASFYGLQQSEKLKEWETHTQEVLISLEETLSAFGEIHSIIRGFILFTDPNFLKNFYDTKAEIYDRLNKVDGLIRDNPEQQKRLKLVRSMIDEKIAYLEEQVVERQRRSIQSYSVPFRSPKGIPLTEKIKDVLREMKKEEAILLTARKKKSELNLTIATAFVFSGIVLNLSFIILQNFLIYRESKRRRSAENALEESNKNLKTHSAELERSNKDLEAFSYSVSHDLRAPIRAISGFSKILMEDHGNDLGEEGRRILNIVIQNSENMGQLIDDLLEYSRLGRREIAFSVVNMKSMAEKILEEITNYYPETKIETIVGDLPQAKADSGLLKQLLFNLVSNAFKYSNKKDFPKVEIGSYQNDGETVFFVKDNGAGFDMKYQHKLFNIFQRLHHADQFEGTGVGLAIVKRVIEKHDGRVWGEGKPDEGACFYFTLGAHENHG
ncbi:sensor histidine kinase [Leptospira kmetyi]|uniref:sensor histidine kinase n=1 Tax=Leptospira kmetyi TaxID=408139 RepID=UPI000A00322A|nr:sensor histidine kinase [Leptospira kmetyi]